MNLGRLLIEAIKKFHPVLSVIPVTTLTATITRGDEVLPDPDAKPVILIGQILDENGHRVPPEPMLQSWPRENPRKPGLVSLPISDATARELLGETLEEGHRPALLLFIHIPGSVLNELEASEAKAKEERPRIHLVGGRRS